MEQRYQPSGWALSQAALARSAMIASRVSSLAAESETNAATARCRPTVEAVMVAMIDSVVHWLDPERLELLEVVLHGFEHCGGVPLPIRDFACNPHRLTGTE